MNKANIILMHGKDTDPSKKWYSWLEEAMRERGIKFQAPVLPKADDPNIEEWLSELEKTEPNENSVLVGHSRGGVAILRWLERLSGNSRVKKVILIGTNSGHAHEMDKSENNDDFYTEEGFDFAKIKMHCENFVVMHSRDDEWVPFSAGEENAKGLDAKFLKFEDRGHFGSKLPKQEIPELINEIVE